MPNILIGVPCARTIEAKTTFSLVQTALKAKYRTDLVIQMGCDVAYNRTLIVNEALRRDASHIFFVDSDMFFEEKTLSVLIGRNKDIIGLRANRRTLPLENNVKLLPDEAPSEIIPFKCESIGAGIMLVKTDVFKTIPPPWFQFVYDGSEKKMGEDVFFCRRAWEHAKEVWCDPTLFVKHIGEYLY